LIDLPGCSATAARALNEIAPRLPAKVAIAEQTLIAALDADPCPTCPEGWLSLVARLASHRASVWLAPEVLPQAALAHWPDIADVGVPEGLRRILLDVLLADIAGEARRLTGETLQWSLEEPGAPPSHALLLAREDSLAPVAIVRLDERALGWLAGHCLKSPAHLVAIDGVAVQASAVIDRVAIGRAELAALAPRDIVLLDRMPLDDDGAMTAILCMPGFPGFRVRVVGGRMSVESRLDAAMETPTPPPAASIDDVPLVLDCEVGRVSLTIAQLRELAVGQVLDLGVDATGSVRLQLNGQLVATGELVRIADRTGVRLTTVHLARTA